ncbi:hypothetical protein NE237_005900 [Protea cynaroides]|uniref:Fe2OG dioxygenase domain-containing protein n=1 Tax=Protea cynaroides TaxID=273540 RepID=A0A9Q0KM47_9MAGN|nr:hypothetical protein NE237_005900 [Protea cynaroides]
MSCNSVDPRKVSQIVNGSGNGNGKGKGKEVASRLFLASQRLRLSPNTEHMPDNYDDLQLEYSPVFCSLERYLPPSMLNVSRDVKVQYIREILARSFPQEEWIRAEKVREYRRRIISRYQPLHRELYTLNPEKFFASSFIKAVSGNTEASLRSIISEHSPGIYTFEMLQPSFCELLLSEVENFEKWVKKKEIQIMRPNMMNGYGVALDDFGLETMLAKLMEDFICPISKVFFPEVGGLALDSHHGCVAYYGKDWAVKESYHADDSDVTLNVCLGNQFSGGEQYFRGIRCGRHRHTGVYTAEAVEDYSHVPGKAVLYHGRHRNGAKATAAGHRINLFLWCRSSVFREMERYQKSFPSWCRICQLEKKERQRELVSATKLELFRMEESRV